MLLCEVGIAVLRPRSDLCDVVRPDARRVLHSGGGRWQGCLQLRDQIIRPLLRLCRLGDAPSIVPARSVQGGEVLGRVCNGFFVVCFALLLSVVLLAFSRGPMLTVAEPVRAVEELEMVGDVHMLHVLQQ